MAEVTEAEYIECPNCAAGRIYVPAAEYDGCDCCGWSDGMPIRDWSHRRRPDQHGDHRKG